MHEISYKPSNLQYFVGSLIQQCQWPFISLLYLVQILPDMYSFSYRSLHFGGSSYLCKRHAESPFGEFRSG